MDAAQRSPFGSGVGDASFNTSPPHHLQGSSRQVPPSDRDTAIHQRTYQACIPCRRRKVRCDLGSVDNPHDPPCLRCRREAKECFFSSTRRKKKGTAGFDGDVGTGDSGDDGTYVIKSGRKRLRTPGQIEEPYEDDDDYLEQPRTPGGSIGRHIPLRRPEGMRQIQYGEDDIKASEQTAAILQGAEVHGGHDALKVLYEAAIIRGRTNSTVSGGRPILSGPSPSSLPPATSPIVEKNGLISYNIRPAGVFPSDATWNQKPQQTVTKIASIEAPMVNTPEYAAAVKSWSRFRFVRAGWFSAKEGIAYLEYFYKYLSPLTPITLPDFGSPDTHEKLLTQEPMLAITILLIASRHMRLDGPGSLTRPHTIHQKLWNYLQGMINRVIWGQEQFGGGFCGAGAQPSCDVNPLTRKGLRTLGTVESLMLLTEWHPRAMHFPPDEADDELMIPNEPFENQDLDGGDDGTKGIGGQRMDSWLEPCWRSDKMCWMLLGMAMSLAFEIGVFDKGEWQRHTHSANDQPLSAEELHLYDQRRGKIRDLLLINVTLTSGRVGLTSMLPTNYSKPEDSDLYKRQIGEHGSIQETVLQFWLRIAAIMRDGNNKIFANKNFTRDLIKNGSYKAALEQFKAPLSAWRYDFDACPVIPKFMRHILEIEYEYCRVYLNSLGLQAVAERCANEYPQINNLPMGLPRSAITTNGIRTDVAIDPQTLSKWLGGDRRYMIEVREAACNLLTVVIDGLFPDEYLKHAPVRSYFRIISVAIMLLKSFSLGASETDVADSFKLMDRTVEALRTCIVDDVHVASRFADLLDTLTQNLKPRLVRMSADGRNGRSRRHSMRSTPFPGNEQTNNGTAYQTQQFGQQQATLGALQSQQSPWNSNVPTSGTNGATDPLYGVSNDTYDLFGSTEYSLMPPPTFGINTPGVGNPSSSGSAPLDYSVSAAGPPTGNETSTTNYMTSRDAFSINASGMGGEDMQDWLALPLNNLLAMPGADVNQTMYGPELGGTDMLELLLNGNTNF